MPTRTLPRVVTVSDWISLYEAIVGGVGLVLSAAVAGYFALRTNRQNAAAAAAQAEVKTLGSEVSEALALVAKLVDKDTQTQQTITELRRRLIDCLEDRYTAGPRPDDRMGR